MSNSLIVLPNFSEIVDKVLGITDVTSAVFLEVLDEDEDEGEGAVDDVNGEVSEEDQYPKKY